MVFALAGAVAVLVIPDRLQWVIFIRSAGANEVVVPIGYWIAVAVWAWLVARLLRVSPSAIAHRAVAVGVLLHALLLLVAFSRSLAEHAAFSTPFYRLYARLICAAALACAMAWAIQWVRGNQRDTTAARADLLDVPLLIGIAGLVAALLRRDPMIAVGGLAIGGAIGAWLAADSAAGRAPSTARSAIYRIARDERLFLLVVFVAATALRVLYTRRVMTDPDFVATGGDGPTYDALAWSIAQGHGVPAGFRAGYPLLMLGYVWFVGAVYAIVGHSYFVLCTIQSALGAATCILVFAVARPLLGSTVARVAAVATAVNFLLLFSAASIGHQAVDVFLTALIVWLLYGTTRGDPPTLLHWAGIGVVVGCAIAVRETNAFFLAFVILWIPFAFRRRVDAPPAARAVVALMLGVLVLLTPVVVPMVSTAENRLRLRQHFDRLFTGQGDDVRTRKDLAGPLESPTAALAQLRTSPRYVVGTLGRAMIHNVALQFFTQPYGGFDMIFLVKGSAYYYGMWFYAYAFACAGILICLRRTTAADARAAGIALAIGVIVSRTLPHLVLESHFRHRAPIEPFLILMASLGVVSLFAASAQRIAPDLDWV